LATNAPAVGAQMQTPAVNPRQAKMLPFRRATVERSDMLPSESLTMTTSQQPILRDLQGDGFMYEILLHVNASASGNAANVAFNEDAPWNAINNPVLKDVNGELVNLKDGFELYLCNLAMKNYAVKDITGSAQYSVTTGAVGAGGSFNFWLPVPVGINRNNLLGIVGNQDRAQKYSLRTNLAASSDVYSTAPTTLPSVIIEKYYENYSVPLANAPDGTPQQQLPDAYGVLHFLTSSIDQTAPSAGSKNHYLQRIGNTIRYIILVFRQGTGTPRANAEAAMNSNSSPAIITFKVGSDTIFYETYNARRVKMYNRYGFDWPAGVLVYDTIHDNLAGAGVEHGNDWYHTAGLSNCQFIINYPSAFTANANNSLTVITDDLVGI
jgi:hypothetical protein